MRFLLDLLNGGAVEVLHYFAAHIIIAIIPAVFIAGAVGTFFSRERFVKAFTQQDSLISRYFMGAVAGTVLTISARGIVPLFASLYGKKKGLGPSFSLLYSGPAINVIAIALTFRVLGWQFGLARIAGAFFFSVMIGLAMNVIWHKSKTPKLPKMERFELDDDYLDKLPPTKTAVFFLLLTSVLIFSLTQKGLLNLLPAGTLSTVISWLPAIGALVAVVTIVNLWFTQRDFSRWMAETWHVALRVIPLLFVGVFLVGVLKTGVPHGWITAAVGDNSLPANVYSSVFGSVMYFAVSTEVPLTNILVQMGMGQGPALALLLAGPALSLPNIITLGKALGWMRMLSYVLLVILASVIAGLFFGCLHISFSPQTFGI